MTFILSFFKVTNSTLWIHLLIPSASSTTISHIHQYASTNNTESSLPRPDRMRCTSHAPNLSIADKQTVSGSFSFVYPLQHSQTLNISDISAPTRAKASDRRPHSYRNSVPHQSKWILRVACSSLAKRVTEANGPCMKRLRYNSYMTYPHLMMESTKKKQRCKVHSY